MTTPHWIESTKPYIIAEIGINHNGSIELAKKLIDVAIIAGCDAVKFQKRTIPLVYTAEELAQPRQSPFGSTNGQLKAHLEFGQAEYEEIADYCITKGIDFSASCWDPLSVDFIEQFNPKWHKVASPMLTNLDLLRKIKEKDKWVIASIGMSTLEEIETALDILGTEKTVLLVCTSTYPNKDHEISLGRIQTLRDRFGLPVGYSGHELGYLPTILAVGLGAVVVERHITLSKEMFGSDQSISLEPQELISLVNDIKKVHTILQDREIKPLSTELPFLNKLRPKPQQSQDLGKMMRCKAKTYEKPEFTLE